MANVHVGDAGTEITVDLGEDLTGATLLKIVIKRPTQADRYIVETPVVEDDTKVVYTTVDGDLSADGQYEVQVYYADANWSGYSTVANFTVDRRLYDVLKDIS